MVHSRGSRRWKLDCEVEETRYIQFFSQNDGTIQDTNNSAVYDAFKLETPILAPLAFAASRNPSSRREKEWFSRLL